MVQLNVVLGRAHALGLIGLVVLLATGCASNLRGVFHIPVPQITQATRLAARQDQLIAELQASDHTHRTLTPPEELAAMAREEVIAGHLWDAGVLTAMATHRYYAMARAVSKTGSQAGYDAARAEYSKLPPRGYEQLVVGEIKLLLQLNYVEQSARLGALLGVPLDPFSVRDDWVRVALGNLRNRHQAEAAFTQRIDHLKTPPPEQLHYPQLAEAFIAYLRSEASDDEYPAWATRALARTPLASAWHAALEVTPSHVFYDVVLASALLYARSPKMVIDALRSSRPQTRGNAAVALGLIEDLGTLPALEAAYTAETDPRAKLCLSYALVRLGEAEHLDKIVHAMGSADNKLRGHALLLGQWLREDLKRRVPEEPYVRAIDDEKLEGGLREVCVMMLGDLGDLRPLAEPTISALLEAALEGSDSDPFRDVIGNAFGRIKQLDRSRVLAALRSQRPPMRPWLHRLAAVAEPQDLGLVSKLMSDSNEDHVGKREDIVQATYAIPGPAAQAQLERWYQDDPKLRGVLALSLILRDDVDKERLWQLAQRVKDVYSLALRMPLARENLDPVLRTYLDSNNLDDRLFAIRIIGLFGTREQAQLLSSMTTFSADQSYPAEVVLRHLALAALLDVELNARRAHVGGRPEAPPVPEPAPPAAPEPAAPQAPLPAIPPPA